MGTSEIPIFSTNTVANSDKVTVYDSLDADVVQSYMEFSLASLVFYDLKEGATSKQASEMIDKLRISFNRTRQAVITGELIEIISGAAAFSLLLLFSSIYPCIHLAISQPT